MQNTRRTIVAINKVATKGDRFTCKSWGHMRRISWTGDTPPREVQELRSGKGGTWGGATLSADQVAIIFDGEGQGPSEMTAWAEAVRIFKGTP